MTLGATIQQARRYTLQERQQVITWCLLGISATEQARRLGRTQRAIWQLHERLRAAGLLSRRAERQCGVAGCRRRHRRYGFCDSHSKKAGRLRGRGVGQR